MTRAAVPARRPTRRRAAPVNPCPRRTDAIEAAGNGHGPALPPLLVTLPQAAAMLGVSLRTVASMTAAGELPTIRLGKRAVRIAVADLERFISVRRSGGPAVAGEDAA